MLGGNTRVGVFATRSPYRPNSIGLSAVKLEKIEYTEDYGPVLHVSGADLMNGTPIYDIKPYLPFADSIPDATDGFAGNAIREKLTVDFPEELMKIIPEEKREALVAVLADDPRPTYIDDSERIYGISYGGYEIKFRVKDNILAVIKTEKA